MITSLRNSHVQAARKLKKRGVRDERREFLVEGAMGVAQALSRAAPLQRLFVHDEAGDFAGLTSLARQAGVPVLPVSGAIMRVISSTTTPPGILAVCRFVDRDPAALLKGPLGLVTVLAGVRDPGNAGTILRSSAAVGVDAVFAGGSTVDIYNPKLVRASAGAIFGVPFARNVEIPWLLGELGRLDAQRLAADPKGEVVYHRMDLRRRTALVLGNESWGVAPELAAAVDARVSIPMRQNVESLNVGMAASVILFEAARQRELAG